ncbi:hypothetical protein HY488_00305 [Candidatus Woesearchaeota archaeon]|nr:hypothetical protein [Candidatus Woesearchaeota archaeon]
MLVKEILAQLEANPAFVSWHKKNPDACLAHLFCMVENDVTTWQVGYYNKKTDTITSFDIIDSDIKVYPPEEVFKKKGTGVKELKQENIKIDLDDALRVARELQQQKYPAETPIKEIVVLQTLAAEQVYNITYVTKGFKTLNIKVSSETGKIVDQQLAPIFSFDKGGPEEKVESEKKKSKKK